MAKIKLDTSQLPGFDALPDDVKQALSAYEVDAPDPDYSGYVKKDVFDKKASEAASLSKQLREKMTEDEQHKADEAARMADMEAELKALRRDKTVSDHTARFASLGYDETLASEAAIALADGDMDKVFAAQKKFQANAEKKLRADLLMETPKPAPGAASGGVDYNALVADAQARGDFAAVAYYTRLQAQEAQSQT